MKNNLWMEGTEREESMNRVAAMSSEDIVAHWYIYGTEWATCHLCGAKKASLVIELNFSATPLTPRKLPKEEFMVLSPLLIETWYWTTSDSWKILSCNSTEITFLPQLTWMPIHKIAL